MKIYALICLLLLMGFAGFAQETGALTVEVVDEEDGSSIVFATILLVHKGKVLYGSHTDVNGHTQLKGITSGDYELIVRYSGEKLDPIPIHINANKTLAIKVEATPIELKIIGCDFSTYDPFPNDWSGQTFNADDIRRSPFR